LTKNANGIDSEMILHNFTDLIKKTKK